MKQPPSQQIIEDIFGEIIHLWDSYCDEMNILEQYPDTASFLMHEKVKPVTQALLELILNCYDNDGDQYTKNIKEKFNAK